MNTDNDIRPSLRALLESQRFAVLATDDHGQPFASLMAFAAIKTGDPIFLDIILVWAIVAFLGTAAFAGYYGKRVKK